MRPLSVLPPLRHSFSSPYAVPITCELPFWCCPVALQLDYQKLLTFFYMFIALFVRMFTFPGLFVLSNFTLCFLLHYPSSRSFCTNTVNSLFSLILWKRTEPSFGLSSILPVVPRLIPSSCCSSNIPEHLLLCTSTIPEHLCSWMSYSAYLCVDSIPKQKPAVFKIPGRSVIIRCLPDVNNALIRQHFEDVGHVKVCKYFWHLHD